MPFINRETCQKVSSFHPNSVGAITFKIADLKRDVDSVKATYECGSDPNKPRIDRVLLNMKRKIIKAEQIMKFGQNITARTITQDRTHTLYGRVDTMKKLLKELMKDQSVMTKPDRKALCQMYHQLLSMEDDLVHFTEPAHDHASSTGCKNNGEPQFTTIKDSEVQTNKNEGSGGQYQIPSPCRSDPRNRPIVYTGIGFSRPEIELQDQSSSSVEETWKPMFTFNIEQHKPSSENVAISKPEGFTCPSVSADASLVSVSICMSADETSDLTKNGSADRCPAGSAETDSGQVARSNECSNRQGVEGHSEKLWPTNSSDEVKEDEEFYDVSCE